MNQKKVTEFLRESNAIEGVFDEEALQDAQTAWDYLITQHRMTPDVVLETHRLLMVRQPLEDKYKGAFRDIDVFVGRKKMVSPHIVRMMVGDWCARTMHHNDVDAKALHVFYEHIHPFVDGNGRTGRMFLNWTRLNRTKEGILVIKNAEKSAYYEWFRKGIM